MAEEEDIIRNRVTGYPDDWDVTQGSRDLNYTYVVDKFVTAEIVAGRLTEQLGVKLPLRYRLHAVFGPGGKLATAFALYDNYQRAKKPCVTDVEKVKELFGFEGDSLWYPSIHGLHWRDPSGGQ